MAARERTYPGHTHPGELVALRAPVTPVPLMQIATGFWAFKTLAAAHELDLFTRLAGGAETTAQALARALGIEQRPAAPRRPRRSSRANSRSSSDRRRCS